ncbi:MAG: O-antigen ligase family protein, partial [Bacilli bacterium]
HDRLERTNYPVVNPNYIIKEDIKNIIKDKKNIGNGRLEIWKNSIPLVKKYWLVGSGLDTFAKVYEQENNIIHDKAHNIYLQMLITNGFFSLFLYLSLLLIIFIKCLKFKDPLVISLFIAFIGYSIQGFANISVINVAPYFFIIMGLLNEEKMTS